MPNPNASVKFKRKPDTIDAVSATLILTGKPADYPQWVVDALVTKAITVEGGTLSVSTGQGPKAASQGDMITRSATGLLTVYTLDEFNTRYETAP